MHDDPEEFDDAFAYQFQFYDLAKDLRASRFPANKYGPGVIEEWLLLQYEKGCEHHELLADSMPNLGENQRPLAAKDYAVLWHHIATDSFAMCTSATAKRAMWSAIALATASQNDPLMVKHAAPFLHTQAKWAPKDAKSKRIDVFAGVYTPNDYRLTTLVASVQRMQQGDEAATEHLRQWLKSISMAPGVLPARKQNAAMSPDKKDDMRKNQVLWWEVVVPFSQHNPQEKLLSDQIFFYLPISPGQTVGTHLVQSLPANHQQWAYANILGSGQSMAETHRFWKEAFPDSIDASVRDCRLHLALLQLQGKEGKELAQQVDGPTVAMLESLGNYSTKTMTEIVYCRWRDKPQETPELPSDWYDDTALGF